MPAKRRMYTNDLKPDYRALLVDVDEDGLTTPIDLTAATSVRVVGVLIDPVTGVRGETPIFDRPATSVTAGGEVVMEWQAGDTAAVGWIATEVEIMWPGSKPQTIRPPEVIDVRDDFGGAA